MSWQYAGTFLWFMVQNVGIMIHDPIHNGRDTDIIAYVGIVVYLLPMLE
jgi:hypothetical protein